jgi:adenylate cyclase class 1
MPFFAIQVSGEMVNDRTEFTLYCDGRDFSTLEYGDEVFAMVAQYILGKRRQGAFYPIYITDLDLSRLSPESSAGVGLQTIHYLQYKKRIEISLNRAIEASAGVPESKMVTNP